MTKSAVSFLVSKSTPLWNRTIMPLCQAIHGGFTFCSRTCVGHTCSFRPGGQLVAAALAVLPLMNTCRPAASQ
jgi:hypothetical protein